MDDDDDAVNDAMDDDDDAIAMLPADDAEEATISVVFPPAPPHLSRQWQKTKL